MIYIKMKAKIEIIVVILCMMVLVATEEWYEQGHQAALTWQNFDAATMEKGKYKYVKFFTRTCRYCRLMKVIQEQLRTEKQWGFRFYDVDCSIHNDLCSAKIAIPSFPYVGVYNIKGQLEANVGGYYPIETLREAFNIIEKRQIDALALLPPPQMEVKNSFQLPTLGNDISDVKLQEGTKERIQSIKQIKIEEQRDDKQTAQMDEKDQNRKQYISIGIKLCAILLGIWIYYATIKPYHLSLEDCQTKTTLVYIPLKPINENKQEQVKPTQQNYQSLSTFPSMSDNI